MVINLATYFLFAHDYLQFIKRLHHIHFDFPIFSANFSIDEKLFSNSKVLVDVLRILSNRNS